MADGSLVIGKSLRIPRAELEFHATRAGGPGGQHVNTSSTRIELWWNLEASSAPNEAQRALLRERLGHRLDAEGWLRLVEAGSRSQHRNRESVTERFSALLARALTPRKVRKPTRVPAAEKRRRLERKRQRSVVKRLRGKVTDE
ncbi:MAG TPA: alternative ribosome rescue aminoacyl-tRNA hydrolase ArfB [Gemmatimonadales bacterium]|jgi:ribosome-associated protein|nr:alternative ribosome rescue aminoacyl-tRNA hydrolase ArfB [Gemmatimonadales bacterium]